MNVDFPCGSRQSLGTEPVENDCCVTNASTIDIINASTIDSINASTIDSSRAQFFGEIARTSSGLATLKGMMLSSSGTRDEKRAGLFMCCTATER